MTRVLGLHAITFVQNGKLAVLNKSISHARDDPPTIPAKGVRIMRDTTLAARISQLERELAALRRQHADEEDRRLVLAIVRSVGGAVFSARDLVAHARVDPALRDALGDMRPRRLGKRLARLTDRPLEGVTVRRVDGRDAHGCMWFVDIHDDRSAPPR
jgi:hypothetical protein